MKDISFRHILYVLPIVLAIAAALFIARAGTPDVAADPVPRSVDMNVPF